MVSTEDTNGIGAGRPERLRADEYLYLAFLVFLPVLYPLRVKFYGLVVAPADALFAGAAVAWLVGLARGKARLRRSWFYLPLALYLVAAICSAAASEEPARSAVKLAGKVYLISIAALTFNLVTSPALMRRAAGAWLVGTALTVAACLAGIVLFYAGFRGPYNFALHSYGSLPHGHYPRVDGFFEYAAMLCNYLDVSFAVALVMLSAGWLSARWARPLIVSIWVAAAFTLTPGIGGLALITGLWLGRRLNRTGRRGWGKLAVAWGCAAALAFFAAAALVLFSFGPEGAEVPLVRGRVEPSHRAEAWQTAFETFKQHPVFGRGVGTEVSSAGFIDFSGRRVRLTDAHNTYLSVAGETGLVGLVTFGGILVFLLSGGSHSGRALKTYLVLGLVGAFFYEGLVGSFEDARHVWALFGLIAAAREGWRGQTSPV